MVLPPVTHSLPDVVVDVGIHVSKYARNAGVTAFSVLLRAVGHGLTASRGYAGVLVRRENPVHTLARDRRASGTRAPALVAPWQALATLIRRYRGEVSPGLPLAALLLGASGERALLFGPWGASRIAARRCRPRVSLRWCLVGVGGQAPVSNPMGFAGVPENRCPDPGLPGSGEQPVSGGSRRRSRAQPVTLRVSGDRGDSLRSHPLSVRPPTSDAAPQAHRAHPWCPLVYLRKWRVPVTSVAPRCAHDAVGVHLPTPPLRLVSPTPSRSGGTEPPDGNPRSCSTGGCLVTQVHTSHRGSPGVTHTPNPSGGCPPQVEGVPRGTGAPGNPALLSATGHLPVARAVRDGAPCFTGAS